MKHEHETVMSPPGSQGVEYHWDYIYACLQILPTLQLQKVTSSVNVGFIVPFAFEIASITNVSTSRFGSLWYSGIIDDGVYTLFFSLKAVS